ncbi:MAG: HAD hydrolase-like protein, partial [Sandaracinobacteroides sp.]
MTGARLAVFDCDGTLVDSQANIIRAMHDSFAAMGLADPDPHAVRRVVGLSLVEAMQALLPDA